MLIVVGGHSRNIGKTSVAAGLIAALPEARWTAVKITQHGHGVCSAAGEPCDCAVDPRHPFEISEETEPNATDSGRFLAAGAVRSWWLRTAQDRLGGAMEALRAILPHGGNAMIESNSVVGFLRPDLYLMVVDSRVADWKVSAQRHLDRADAIVEVRAAASLPERLVAGKPRFRVAPPYYANSELVEFVRSRLSASSSRTAPATIPES
jgi:hypothetical protein